MEQAGVIPARHIVAKVESVLRLQQRDLNFTILQNLEVGLTLPRLSCLRYLNNAWVNGELIIWKT